MMTIEDYRVPFQLSASHFLRLEHVVHVAVAVVIVPDVLLIQIGQRADLIRRTQVLSIPRDDFVLTVRIQRRPQHHDDVVQNRIDLRIALGRDELISQLNRVLRAGHLGGVKPTVEMNDRLALVRERFCLVIGQSTSESQPPRNIFVSIEPLEILGR